MKNLLLPFLTILLFAACERDATVTPNASTLEKDAPALLDVSQAPVFVQDHLKNLLENKQQGVQPRSPENGGQNGAKASNEPVFNLAEDQTTCVDEAGHCSVNRTNDGAHFSWHSKGLVPGGSYQLYVVVINFDENCFPDFFGGPFDVITLGIEEANPAGNLNLNTFLANGDNSNSWFGPFGPGMTNSKQADLILFARYNADGMDKQISGHFVCNPTGDCFQ